MDFDKMEQLLNLASDMSLPKNTKETINDLFKGKTLQEIQAMDPVAEWEKLMGKNYKTNSKIDDLSLLGFVGAFNKEKTARLVSVKETNNSMTYDEFVDLMKEKGFKIGYSNTYKGSDGKNETEMLMFDEKYGFIIYATSYSGRLNSATLYGEIGPSGYSYKDGDENKYKEVKELYDDYYRHIQFYSDKTLAEYINKCIVRRAGVPQHSSNGLVDGIDAENIYDFDFDMREGACAKIDKLRNEQTFAHPIAEWMSKKRFLWFMNSSENSDNFRQITDKKISISDPAIAKIINDPNRIRSKDTTADKDDSNLSEL